MTNFKSMTLAGAFPAQLKASAAVVCNKFEKLQTDPPHEYFNAVVSGETISIPERIYMRELSFFELLSMNKEEPLIAYCLLTRHHDGYIRQKYLNKIIHHEQEWVCPFVIRLLGEYVDEICQDILRHFSSESFPFKPYIKFIEANPKVYATNKARMVSYWNCYYQFQHEHLKDYPGYRAFEKLDSVLQQQ